NSWALGVASYGAPAIEPGGSRIFVAAYDDNQLIEFDRLAGEVVEAHDAVEPPVRVTWAAGEVWATSGVNKTVDAYSPDTLERRWTAELADQTQGIWYDPNRDLVWVAVFGDNEVLAIDRSTGDVIGRASVQQPIDLFPLPR
ncbi:MAG: DNA-binding beta-propeller fold protein YncE, partial [Kiritimatiellia bacterium]